MADIATSCRREFFDDAPTSSLFDEAVQKTMLDYSNYRYDASSELGASYDGWDTVVLTDEPKDNSSEHEE